MNRLNNMRNYKVYFKPLIDEVYYEKIVNIQQKYSDLGLHKIGVSFVSSSIYVESVINIKNGIF